MTPQLINFTNEAAKVKFTSLISIRMQRTNFEREIETKFRGNIPIDLKRIDDALKISSFMDNFIVGVGSGGFKVKKVIKESPRWSIVEWETGAKWRVGTAETIWARQYIEYPVKSEEDLDRLELPDPDDPSRYEGIRKAIRYVIDRGFFPSCSINGFFSGVWYFLRGPLDIILKDMYMQKDFYRKLIAKIGEFNLKAEKNLLERGALMIEWPDDLGYSRGTFMNPKLYEELIYPWHLKAIELAHKYGAFVNMHSHGKIDTLVPLLVKAKLDMLNPVGPTDNMDLKSLKEKYGEKLCFLGGLSKHIGLMSLDELKEHLIDRIRTGAPGGGYILGSEGGIPPEMSPEKFEVFLKMSKKYRRNMP